MKYILLVITLFISQANLAQDHKTKLEQDPFFKTLLNEKIKLNQKTDLKDRYKVQVYYGGSSECKSFLNQFKKDFKELESTIVYTNPSFKVWVGNFETRLEGEHLLKNLKKDFPTALLIKPSK